MAGLMFVLSGMVVFRQSTDLTEYCKPQPDPSVNDTLVGDYFIPSHTVMESGRMNMTALIMSDKPLHQIFASIDRMNYMTKHLSEPNCYEYSSWEVF